MTDDKTKQKAIEAAADIFGDYYNYFLTLVTFNSNSILVCGYSLLLLRGNFNLYLILFELY